MNVKQLESLASEVRQSVIKSLLEAGSGHSAGSLGFADVLVDLYFEIAQIDPRKPNHPDRDRIVLSCGHLAPLLYAVMAQRGYFPKDELLTLRKFRSRLEGHPNRLALEGLETSSGSLGQGLSLAVGMALSAKIDQARWRTYALLSDAEHNEGQTWEAIMLASKYQLHNLTAVVDRNSIQIDGFTEDVMPLESLSEKYRSFDWYVIEVNGHSHEEIIGAFRHARAVFEKPTVVIAHTIPGKGVGFMENDYRWHGKAPKKDEAAQAIKELRTLKGKIQSELD